jgi:hypothetical protein
MNDLRCPHVDVLGNRLIEAYRKLSDAEIFVDSISTQAQAEMEMVAIKQEIVRHRQECFLCQAAQCRQEAIRAFAVDEPIWRGTMAS